MYPFRIPSIKNCTPFIYLWSNFYQNFHLRNPLTVLNQPLGATVQDILKVLLIRKWQFLQPFSILQLVKSLPFYVSLAWKGYPFWQIVPYSPLQGVPPLPRFYCSVSNCTVFVTYDKEGCKSSTHMHRCSLGLSHTPSPWMSAEKIGDFCYPFTWFLNPSHLSWCYSICSIMQLVLITMKDWTGKLTKTLLQVSLPANSHTLCMCHMPADQKLRSHALRAISHIWLSILNYFLINHQCEKFNAISTKHCPVDGAKCCVSVLNNTQKCQLQKCLDPFRNLLKSSEHFGNIR